MLSTMRSLLAVSLAVLTSASCAGHAKQSISLYEAGDYAGAAKAADDGLASHPDDDALWGMRVRAALALGDAAAVAHAYGDYTSRRGSDDRELLRDLSTATLLQALKSPSAVLELRAITAIEDLEVDDLADDVAQAMGAEDERVQAAAAVAVIHGYAQAAHVAYDLLQSDNPEARRIALDGVAKKIGKLAIADIEKGANDSDPRVRAVALRWLGHYKDAEAVEVCTRRLRDPDASVRAAAARALGTIGLGDLTAVAKRALADKAVAVRLAGVAVLAAVPGSDAQLAMVAGDPDPTVALAAAIEIKRTHPELVQPAVQRALAATDWTIRAGALNVLAQAVGREAAVATAKPLTADAELGVRLAAARVLAHAGDPEDAARVFADALAANDASGTAHVAAAADLAALGDPRGLTALAALTSDPKRTPEQRVAAVAAHREAHHVTPALVAALADSSGLVRVEAAAVLGALAK